MAKQINVAFTVNDDTSHDAFWQWLQTCPYAKGENVTMDAAQLQAATLTDVAKPAPKKTAKKAPAKKKG